MKTEAKNTEYPKWFIDMAQDFLDMRDAQNKYFKSNTKNNLSIAKTREAKADNWLERMIKAKLIKHQQNPTDLQKTIFN